MRFWLCSALGRGCDGDSSSWAASESCPLPHLTVAQAEDKTRLEDVRVSLGTLTDVVRQTLMNYGARDVDCESVIQAEG